VRPQITVVGGRENLSAGLPCCFQGDHGKNSARGNFHPKWDWERRLRDKLFQSLNIGIPKIRWHSVCPCVSELEPFMMPTDPEVLNYILTVFPPELQLLEQLSQTLREQNSAKLPQGPADVEPVLVTAMWMRRVLERAKLGELDLKGIFELSACLANELPKVQAQREAELRKETMWGNR
jgi:hypothetical protein